MLFCIPILLSAPTFEFVWALESSMPLEQKMLQERSDASARFVAAGAIHSIDAKRGIIRKEWQPEGAEVRQIFANGVCLAVLNKSSTSYLSYDIASHEVLTEFEDENIVKDHGAITSGKLPFRRVRVGKDYYYVVWDSPSRRLLGTDRESGGGDLKECKPGTFDVIRNVRVRYYLPETHLQGNPDKGPFALVCTPTIPVQYPKYARLFGTRLTDIGAPENLNLIWDIRDNIILASITIDTAAGQKQGELYCLDAASGATRWSFQSTDVVNARLVQDFVVVAAGKGLIALSKQNGMKVAELQLSTPSSVRFFIGDYIVAREGKFLKAYHISSAPPSTAAFSTAQLLTQIRRSGETPTYRNCLAVTNGSI